MKLLEIKYNIGFYVFLLSVISLRFPILMSKTSFKRSYNDRNFDIWIFSAVRLHPQTPSIDKREIGDAAIPGDAECILLLQPPPPSSQLGPLANERAVSSDVRCDVAHFGREKLHHFLPVLSRGMLPLFNIMTLWPVFSMPRC